MSIQDYISLWRIKFEKIVRYELVTQATKKYWTTKNGNTRTQENPRTEILEKIMGFIQGKSYLQRDQQFNQKSLPLLQISYPLYSIGLRLLRHIKCSVLLNFRIITKTHRFTYLNSLFHSLTLHHLQHNSTHRLTKRYAQFLHSSKLY